MLNVFFKLFVASPITGIISPASESPTSPNSNSRPMAKTNIFKDYINKIGTWPIKLIKKSNWSFSNEISYLFLTKDSNSMPLLYIGLNGNNYATVNFQGKLQKFIHNEKDVNTITERKQVKNSGKKSAGKNNNNKPMYK